MASDSPAARDPDRTGSTKVEVTTGEFTPEFSSQYARTRDTSTELLSFSSAVIDQSIRGREEALLCQ